FVLSCGSILTMSTMYSAKKKLPIMTKAGMFWKYKSNDCRIISASIASVVNELTVSSCVSYQFLNDEYKSDKGLKNPSICMITTAAIVLSPRAKVVLKSVIS